MVPFVMQSIMPFVVPSVVQSIVSSVMQSIIPSVILLPCFKSQAYLIEPQHRLHCCTGTVVSNVSALLHLKHPLLCNYV